MIPIGSVVRSNFGLVMNTEGGLLINRSVLWWVYKLWWVYN